jgi:hypothetical protein
MNGESYHFRESMKTKQDERPSEIMLPLVPRAAILKTAVGQSFYALRVGRFRAHFHSGMSG